MNMSDSLMQRLQLFLRHTSFPNVFLDPLDEYLFLNGLSFSPIRLPLLNSYRLTDITYTVG